METMNSTSTSVSTLLNDSKLLSVATSLTTIFGLAIFLENIGLIALIVKLCLKQDVKDTNDIIIHTLFVCANDMLSGFAVFVLSFIRVTDEGKAHFCVYTLILSLSLQMMSQGNMTCICVQRYIGARNIRKLTNGRQRYRTVILMLVNVFVGGGSLVSSITQSYRSVKPSYKINDLCSFGNVLEGNSQSIVIVIYNTGLLLTIAANVLCFLTIRKLRTEINSVVQPEGTSTTMTTSSTHKIQTNHNNGVRTSIRLQQQKAIFVLLFILVLLNLSIVPTLFGFTMALLGWKMTVLDRRLLYLSLFLNSLINPVIIATRVPVIRQEIIKMTRRVLDMFKRG